MGSLKPSASHPVIAAFGKLKAYAQDEMALCSADCSHYFAIIESVVDSERHLRIVWSEDKNDLLGNSAQKTALNRRTQREPVKQPAQPMLNLELHLLLSVVRAQAKPNIIR
jgi:hypothetical protein